MSLRAPSTPLTPGRFVMSVPVRLAFVIRAVDSSEFSSADNFFWKPSMSEVASFLFLVIDEFPCSDLIKVLHLSGAAEVFSQALVIP